ncbi:MAG TPA: glutamate 5-kinase [Candidatus Angelobacter sp.]|jgi:glutamate 5-kinase|nr:glutamate 5-kinase [Candidatus Angelobacter sp.]
MKPQVAAARRLVVKVGSALLVDAETGTLHREWLTSLLQDIADYWRDGKQIIIVSSGAIAIGRCHLPLKNHTLQLEEKQAAAAIGQIKLAKAYQEILEQQGIIAAQVLLTLEDSEDRSRYLNAKNTLETLLKLRAVPIINENDTIATTEIRFGDNDRLAARVGQMVSADTLVLLSDIDGLYTKNPRLDSTAELVTEVTRLTPDILAMAGDSSTVYGSGGMITKLAAAKIALASGCRMAVAAGKHLHPLKRIDTVDMKTWFIPETTPANARKNWIAQHLKPKGNIIIDAGAVNALHQGKSLLAAGIRGVEGHFHEGDAVCILTENRQEIAKGLVNYPAQEVVKIIGKKSSEFETVLGYRGYEEIIHRDDLAGIS